MLLHPASRHDSGPFPSAGKLQGEEFSNYLFGTLGGSHISSLSSDLLSAEGSPVEGSLSMHCETHQAAALEVDREDNRFLFRWKSEQVKSFFLFFLLEMFYSLNSWRSAWTDWGQPSVFLSPEGEKNTSWLPISSCNSTCQFANEYVDLAFWSKPSIQISILDADSWGQLLLPAQLSFTLSSILWPPHPCFLSHPYSESGKRATIPLPLTA